MQRAHMATAVAVLVIGIHTGGTSGGGEPTPRSVGLPALSPDAPAVIDLGRRLFMDRRLSVNGTMSCAMCHVPEHAFTHNGIATAVGVNGKSLRRNAPSLLNVVFHAPLFHDGRETSLEDQVFAPLLAADEMGNRTLRDVIDRIGTHEDYAGSFERAFGTPASAETLARAIAAYERSLVSAGSRFDRWRYAGESVLDEREQRGFALFTGKARCSTCHTVGEHCALFTDGLFHNTGLPEVPRDSHNVHLAPGVTVSVAAADLRAVSEPWHIDLGRFEITGVESDRHAFKTPSLRNVALTSPYMHDGSMTALEQVVEFYDRGGGSAAGKDPLLRPLGLDPHDKQAIVAFLGTLTGANVHILAQEARAAFSHAVWPEARPVR